MTEPAPDTGRHDDEPAPSDVLGERVHYDGAEAVDHWNPRIWHR